MLALHQRGPFPAGMAGGLAFVRGLSPAAWYRYNTGITVTGAGVSSWADQSGNSRPLLQGTDTNRPALQADGSILFDGSDNQLEATFTHNQPVTWFVLLKQITSTSGDVVFDGSAALASCFQGAVSPALGANAGSASSGNSNLALDTYGVVYVVFNGASSALGINKTTALTGNYGANNPGGFSVGANRGLAGASNIQVKEIILFDTALVSATIARVVRYLGIVGQLGI